MEKEQKASLICICVSALLLAGLMLLPVRGVWKLLLFLAAYLPVGGEVLSEAWEGIKEKELFDECFLMAVATLGAAALGQLTEAVAVMLFYRVGELFEDIAVEKSRSNIRALAAIRPDHANLFTEDGEMHAVPPEQVTVGSVIAVLPGERIPLDGTVLSGRSDIDTSPLTGESLPRAVDAGESVYAGCINLTGSLQLRTVKAFSDSAAERVLALAESAAANKSRPESFMTRFARIYTPAVCLSALLLAAVPPVINLLGGLSGEFSLWVYRALTFLVISCPCALVISIPLTFFAGIGGAGREGILIKGSGYVEALSALRCVALDKTGTVTTGKLHVSEICPAEGFENMIEYAALAESFSTHPAAAGILRAYGKDPDASRVREVRELGGRGVTALVDGVTVAAGNRALMAELGIDVKPASGAGTAVFVAVDGRYAGYILLTDTVKPDTAEALRELKRCGVKELIMLTGDSEENAARTAGELGFDSFRAGLLPGGKVEAVEEKLGRGTVAFVGDGINDAPVLARADVGIAMGALGSDAAIEAADVVLMDDDPGKLALAVRLSRRCMTIARENIAFSVGVKLLFLILSTLGRADMWWAVFADVGVMALAVLNAMRALSKPGKRG